MRLGPIFTAFLAGTLSLSFFAHERPSPPTSGHAIAGLAIAAPTAFVIWFMARPGESRDRAAGLLFLQVIATGVAATALAMQRTNLPPNAILLPVAVFLVPLIPTAIWIVRPHPNTAVPSDGQLRLREFRALPVAYQVATVLFILAMAVDLAGMAALITVKCFSGPGGVSAPDCLQASVIIFGWGFIILFALVVGFGYVIFRLMPPDVRATFKEARMRAAAHPDAAPAIAAEFGPRVPPAYRPRLVRIIYIRAGLNSGMSVSQARRSANAAARESQLALSNDQSIAS